MKIYQIHEYGGEWEDYYDYIHSTYLDESKAKSEMGKLIEKSSDCERCISCPVNSFCPPDCEENCSEDVKCAEYCKKYAEENCDNADISVDEDGDLVCKNKIQTFCSDAPSYRIEECKVIE